MTALVSILNKKAAVMAADSAVTISNGDNRKIINTANKIFRLSNSNPVGAMICGSAEYMGIPWEVLFKLYRDKHPSKSFSSLQEYVDDFIDFLRHEKHCCDEKSQKEYLMNEVMTYYQKMKDLVGNDYEEAMAQADSDDVDSDALSLKCLNDNFQFLDTRSDENGVCPELEKYSLKQFYTYAKEIFVEFEDTIKNENAPGTITEWEKHIFHYVRSRLFLGSNTGIVFVGYGEDDIYPTLIPIEIAGRFDGKIRYYIAEDRTEIISNDNSACVCPFAQADTMYSLMKGIHPQMFDTVLEKHEETVNAVKQEMLESMKNAGATEEQLEKAGEVDLQILSDAYAENLRDYIFDTFIKGIVDAVDSFNIEDMITMAESLVSVTNLQRHFSSSEESVGGPVDVAVISKSEGFVWVNHKQWFQREMNPQMIERR